MTDPAIRDLARRLTALERSQRGRATQLEHSALEDGALREFDLDGQQVAQYGKQYDDTHVAASLVGPPPPQPTSPVCTPVAGGFLVHWDGLYAAGDFTVAPMDWLRTDVAIGPVGFNPLATPPATSITSPRGGRIFVGTTPGDYEVVLIARTQSGKASPPSAAVAVTALADADAAQIAADVAAAEAIAAAAAGTADDALAAANGKNAITHADYAPTNEANTVGDTWFQHVPVGEEGEGDIAAQFTGLGGTSWQATSISHQVIASIDLGKATVGRLSANYIDTGTLAAALTLTGYLLAGNPTGARVVIDEEGIRQYDASGNLLTNIPTDPNQPATFEGAVIADSITIKDYMSLQGLANKVARGAVLTLEGGTSAPAASPSVAIGYETYDGGITEYLFTNRGFHHDADGSSPYLAGEFFGYGCLHAPNGKYHFPAITMNGSQTSTRSMSSMTMVRTSGGVRQVVYTGRGVNGGTDRTWALEVYDPSPMVPDGSVPPLLKSSLVHGTNNFVIANKIGRCYSSVGSSSLDSNFAFAEWNTYVTPKTIKFRRFSCTDTAITQQGSDLTVNSPLAAGEDMMGVSYGSSVKMAFPGTDQMIWLLHGTVNTYAYSNTGTRLPDFDFPTSPGDKSVGSVGSLAAGAMTFGGFRMSPSYRPAEDKPLLITKYTNNHWVGSTSAKWWASTTNHDADITGGTHESQQGPRASLTMKKRAGMLVTVPPYPVRPSPTTTDDPLSAKIYIGRGASDPGRTYMEYAGTTHDPNRSLLVGTFAFPAGLAATPPPATSDFPASSPAKIIPGGAANWQLLGDGSATIGGLVVAADTTCTLAAHDVAVGNFEQSNQRVMRWRKKNNSSAVQHQIRMYAFDGGISMVVDQDGVEQARTEFNQIGAAFRVKDTIENIDSFYRADGINSEGMRMLEFRWSDNTAATHASTGSAALGARGGEGTFVAPPSGSVMVAWQGLMRSATTATWIACQAIIRTGATIGSGTLLEGYNTTKSALVYVPTYTPYFRQQLYTGLTPGATYNVQQIIATSNSTAGAEHWRGHVFITPSP